MPWVWERRLSDQHETDEPKPLLGQPLQVLNIGLERFAEDLAENSVETVQVEWRPPAGGNEAMANIIADLGY